MGGRTRAPLLVLLGGLTVFTAVPLIVLALRASSRGEWFPGADAPTMFDQLQYFAWIRDASDHLLASDLFRLGPSSHVFADPVFVVSAGLRDLGLSVPLSYLVWAPLAVVLLATGPCVYARQRLRDEGAAVAAAAIGIFYLGPLFLIAHWTGLVSTGTDGTLGSSAIPLFPGVLLLGGLPFVIALGLVPIAFVLVERERMAAAALIALLVAWIHPWQGLQIAFACGALVVVERTRASLRLLAPITGAVVPLAYYAALAKWNADWRVAHAQAIGLHVTAWAFLVAVAPLLALAVAGVADPRGSRGELLLLAWIGACVVAFVVSPSVAAHALFGITVPLAVLAVRGWQRLGWSRAVLAGAAVALAVASSIYAGQTLRDSVRAGTQPYSLKRGEMHALAFLAHAPPGGVLARTYAGSLIPAFTGHQTWVGHATWTPDFVARARLAERLITTPTPPAVARAFVRATGARYLLADCRADPGLPGRLAPLVAAVHRFGCATLLTLSAKAL